MKDRNQIARLCSFYQDLVIEAGVDEAGRGSYAGPVVAAAVILPKGFYHPLLNDSKKINPAKRYHLRTIIEAEALSFSYSFVTSEIVDKINVLQATFKAMHEAIAKLELRPELLLIDGNRFKPVAGIKHCCIVGGDGKYASIAAASIIAKTYRDDYMKVLHEKFPCYGWGQNKGYGTLSHRKAIEEFGLCMYHRKSFSISGKQLMLDLDKG